MTTDVIVKPHGPIYTEILSESFKVINAIDGIDDLEPSLLRSVRVVVTTGTLGVSRAEMEMLPALGLICTLGTGYENVDLMAARERGIKVTHAAGTNAPAVAEYAIGLILALVRKIPNYFESSKTGLWRGDIRPQPMITGKRLGIFGLGGIGARIGRLAEAFEMDVSYFSRTKKCDVPWTYRNSLRELAEAVDFLVIAAPGGEGTFHAVDADVLSALGPRGYLVNVGRGTIIDTSALVQALHDSTIAGAALDVFETEPDIPNELRVLDNVVLTPHVGGVTSDAQAMSARLIVRNIKAFLAGMPLVSPVPEMRD